MKEASWREGSQQLSYQWEFINVASGPIIQPTSCAEGSQSDQVEQSTEGSTIFLQGPPAVVNHREKVRPSWTDLYAEKNP